MAKIEDVFLAFVEKLKPYSEHYYSWAGNRVLTFYVYKPFNQEGPVKFSPYTAQITLNLELGLLHVTLSNIYEIDNYNKDFTELREGNLNSLYYFRLNEAVRNNTSPDGVAIKALYNKFGKFPIYNRVPYYKSPHKLLLGVNKGTADFTGIVKGYSFRSKKITAEQVAEDAFNNIIIPCTESVINFGKLGVGSACETCEHQFNCLGLS